ncbi:MAG TPA: hypothetical protein VGI42_01120, partial [Chthoniobacterales bacterium]
MTQVREERYATSLYNTDGTLNLGVMVNRFEMQPWTYNTTSGYSQGYYTRIQTRGDGCVRTLSYWNNTTGRGQNLIDHFTDWTNNANMTERHEYDWTHYFTTPIKITDMRGFANTQQLEPVLGKVTTQTHPDNTFRTWW